MLTAPEPWRGIVHRGHYSTMIRMATVVSVIALVSACSRGFGPEEGDVTGTWTATLEGTLFHGEVGPGQTTSLTLTLEQTGTRVEGSESFTDTMGRSGSQPVTGSFIGITLSYSRADFDTQCGGRTVTAVGTLTGVDPGSTMDVGFGANASGACPMLTDSLVYTRQ